MRTVSDAPVPGVTSLRLLRSHLMCHTGSSLPFRILVASLRPFVFHACSTAPRGSPRGEAPRAQRFPAHELLPYLRARQFLVVCFLALPTSRAPRALAVCAPFAASCRQDLSLRRTLRRSSAELCSVEVHQGPFASSAQSTARHPLLPLFRLPPLTASSLSSGGAPPSSSAAALRLASRKTVCS
jgi:hypothetical protein